MGNLKKRIKKIEKLLRLAGKVEVLVILHCYGKEDSLKESLPERTEDWLTYQKQLKNKPYDGLKIIHLNADKELEARK